MNDINFNYPIRVFTVCTGVGLIRRGIESQTFDMFKGLHGRPSLDIKLFKGQGLQGEDEYTLLNIPRTGRTAEIIGSIIKRSPYVIEQLSSFLPFVLYILKFKPHIIYYSEINLGFQLYRWRDKIGVPYRLLFNNSGPGTPPFERTHFIHQCTPFGLQKSLDVGEEPRRHILVPLGIKVPEKTVPLSTEDLTSLRKKLNLPTDQTIILSVGLIGKKSHKRMDYLVREIALLPEPRPHLVMIGSMDEDSSFILNLATSALGNNGFTARSVPYEEVKNYYSCADLFVLCSLFEGFGRVYVESLMYGLMTIAHDHPSMRYVLGEEGMFLDMSKDGNLADFLHQLLANPNSLRNINSMLKRQQYVNARYSWDSLYPSYLKMFETVLKEPLPPFKW